VIRGHDLLVFGDDWGVYPTSTEHLLRRFLPHNTFLWVHLPGLRAPQLNYYDVTRIRQKLGTWLTRRTRRSHASNLTVYSPMVIPFNANAVARAWNRQVVSAGVRRLLRLHGMERPIFATSLPNAADLLGSFDEQVVVYFCEDEYSEMPGVAPRYVREVEAKLLERADLVFATSKILAERKSTSRLTAIHLHQGVDFDHFNTAAGKGALPPAELQLPHPIIGYVGLLAPWVDVELFAAVAEAYPKASVVVIAPVRTNISRLQNISNLHLLGPRRYADLPRYMAHFDVGLIPFHQNALTRHVDPLKRLEYFAAGLPVVSTPLPGAEVYKDLVYTAHTRAEFVYLVGKALCADSPELRHRRIETARVNSWDSRAEQASRHIERVLESRRAG
jgi:glycosyltransferase involved in cell wall biosynthesis